MDETAETPGRLLVVQLELQLDREPLSGRLRAAHGREQAFVGWLGFAEALHRLHADADAAAASVSDSDERNDDER